MVLPDTIHQSLVDALTPSLALFNGVKATLPDEDTVAVDWFGEQYLIEIDELLALGIRPSNIHKVLSQWSLQHCVPHDKEVEAWGGYRLWTPIQKRWVIVSKRMTPATHALLPGADDSGYSGVSLDVLTHNDFQATLTGTVVQIESVTHLPMAYLGLPSTERRQVVASHMDLNEDIRFLVRAAPELPVYVGHLSAIERFSEMLIDDYFILSESDIPAKNLSQNEWKTSNE